MFTRPMVDTLSMKRQSTISLCMIVRDEEATLEACLQAASPLVDEMCIVDTGSTDRTLEIARASGAKVRTIPWPNCFSTARNFSIDMATSDWILVLDADEIARPGAEAHLAAIVDDPKIIGAFCEFTNHYDADRSTHCLILRLFRNAPGHRFTGPIHEQVMPAILETARQSGQRVGNTSLHLDHYGYTDEARISKDKDARNRQLFEKAVAECPDDAYLWYKYADFLRKFHETENVIAALLRAIELIGEMPPALAADHTYCGEACALMALEYIRQGQLDEAKAVLQPALDGYLPTAMLHWVHGHLALKLERWTEARDAFEACLEMDGKSLHVPPQPGIATYRSWFGLGRARLGLGESEEAVRMFMEGADRWPESIDLVRTAVKIETSRGEFDRALQRCTRWLQGNPDDVDFWIVGAEVLLEVGLRDKAIVWLERAMANVQKADPALLEGETKRALHALRGECFFADGSFEAALEAWNQGFPHPACQAGAGMILLMVDAPLPDPIERGSALVHAAGRAILRRLERLPEARDARDMAIGALERHRDVEPLAAGVLPRHPAAAV